MTNAREFTLGTSSPKLVTTRAGNAWVVAGVVGDGHVDNLRSTRERATTSNAPEGPVAEPESKSAQERTAQNLPTWLTAHHVVVIESRGTVTAHVTRESHGTPPAKARVSLIESERTLEPTAKVDKPRATLTLDGAGASVSWTSVIEPRDALRLAGHTERAWTELRTVPCEEAWQYQISAPTRRDDGTSEFHPRPRKALQLSLFSPGPAAGELQVVDRADLGLEFANARTSRTYWLSPEPDPNERREGNVRRLVGPRQMKPIAIAAPRPRERPEST